MHCLEEWRRPQTRRTTFSYQWTQGGHDCVSIGLLRSHKKFSFDSNSASRHGTVYFAFNLEDAKLRLALPSRRGPITSFFISCLKVVVVSGALLFLFRHTHFVMTLFRTTEFWKRVLPVYLSYKATQQRAKNMSPEEAAVEWMKRHEYGSTEMYRMCVEMKGMCLKAAQIFGSRSDFMPPEYVEKLSTLQDRVPAYAFSQIRKVVEHELGHPLEEIFSSFEEEPLGSASIAQVHKAVLKDGRVVAVKVQHVGAEDIMRLDLKNMIVLAEFIQKHDLQFDLVSVIRELQDQLPLEFDFQREGHMMETMRSALIKAGEMEGVVIPMVEGSQSSRSVLIMSFLSGSRILDLERLDEMKVDRTAVAQRIAKMYGYQILVEGLFHADPHPGNFLVMDDGKTLGVLDFGQTKQMGDKMRYRLAGHIVALSLGVETAIAATFLLLGIRIGDLKFESFADIKPELFKDGKLSDIVQVARSMFDTVAVPQDQMSPFSETNIIKRMPIIEFPGELFFVLKNIQLMRGLYNSLGVNVSTVHAWAPYAWRAVSEGMREDPTQAAQFMAVLGIDPKVGFPSEAQLITETGPVLNVEVLD